MDEELKSKRSAESPSPSEAEVVQALVEIDQASRGTPAPGDVLPPIPAPRPSWLARNAPLVVFFTVMFAAIALLAWGAQHVVKVILSSTAGPNAGGGSVATKPTTDAGLQAEAEGLLARLAAGDAAAADQVLNESASWTGKTQTTPKTDQLIDTSINLKNLPARAAALQAQLALNGITRDESGFQALEQAAGNPAQRPWALWMLGALGNRGVDPDHAAKIIESYLNDPDVQVRSNAVIGLALLGTDETIAMVLDRFRNGPSPVVQELAGCGLSESGMYTHQQRMVAAATLVGWLDDALLSPQQRQWTAQALHDISGQNFGMDSAAWRHWYDSQASGKSL
jgi:hypothetical protein